MTTRVDVFFLCCVLPYVAVRNAQTAFSTTQKVGTDIQDNKCSWLVVQALERASKAQKAVLIQNYAIDEEAKVQQLGEGDGRSWRERHCVIFEACSSVVVVCHVVRFGCVASDAVDAAL